VSDDSHFVVRVGVASSHPDADPLVAVGKRHRGDFGGGRGEPAQRAKGVPDHRNGKPRGNRQSRHDKCRGGDVLAGDDLVGAVKRYPDDQDVGSVVAVVNPVQTQAAQSFGPRRGVGRGPRLHLEGAHHVSRRGSRLVFGKDRRADHDAVVQHGDDIARRLICELEHRLRHRLSAALWRSMFAVAVSRI
jgi:hypothetical protein